MKVIAVNGSPRNDSNTLLALKLMAGELKKENIETEILNIGKENIHGCHGCGYCSRSEDNHCAITQDCLNACADRIRVADGLILGAPTYYAGIAGAMKCFLDRLFYTSRRYLKSKVGTSVAVARRAGAVDTIHQLNNFLNLAEMVIPPSQYWTVVFGMEQGEVSQDEEGLQTLRKNAQAMAWLLKIIDATKSTIPFPASSERRARTNFIR
ncbi:MAG: flavodoxin family protein [Spirochaetia bacterium]|jgi:multimeric flavodoxin WrbA|nr:flavodoxin family protein [Spirochaetia bacterium]